jgi:hypothetical protein
MICQSGSKISKTLAAIPHPLAEGFSLQIFHEATAKVMAMTGNIAVRSKTRG